MSQSRYFTEFNDGCGDLNLEGSFVDVNEGPCVGGSANGQFGALEGQSLYDVVTENLNEQIRELRDTNARLVNSVHEKDLELEQLRKQTATVSDSLAKDSPGSKIAELAKAKRDLTAKYEAEHSRLLQLQAEKNDLMTRLATFEKKSCPTFPEQADQSKKKCSGRIGEKGGDEVDTSNLHHRLQIAIEHASVANQENQCLKQQLQRTVKALEREVGPNVDIAEILKNPNPTYRGRDQQIQLLRAKLDVTRKHLESFQQLEEESKNVTENPHTGTSLSSVGTSVKADQNDYNTRHRDQLVNDDQKRRADYLTLTEDHQNLRQLHRNLKTQLTSAKARIDYLSKENSRLSQFNRHVLETCQKDAELIRYFQTTITELRNTFFKTSPYSLDSDKIPALPSPDSERGLRSRVPTSAKQSISKKISLMESQIKALTDMHALTFEQVQQGKGHVAAVGSTPSSSISSRIGSAKSVPSRRSVSFSDSPTSNKPSSTYKERLQNTDTRLQEATDSLEEDFNQSEGDKDHIVFDQVFEAGEKAAVILNKAILKEKDSIAGIKDDLATIIESNTFLNLQVDHLKLAKEMDFPADPRSSSRSKLTTRAPVNTGQNRAVTESRTPGKRPAFSCYTR